MFKPNLKSTKAEAEKNLDFFGRIGGHRGPESELRESNLNVKGKTHKTIISCYPQAPALLERGQLFLEQKEVPNGTHSCCYSVSLAEVNLAQEKVQL